MTWSAQLNVVLVGIKQQLTVMNMGEELKDID